MAGTKAQLYNSQGKGKGKAKAKQERRAKMLCFSFFAIEMVTECLPKSQDDLSITPSLSVCLSRSVCVHALGKDAWRVSVLFCHGDKVATYDADSTSTGTVVL